MTTKYICGQHHGLWVRTATGLMERETTLNVIDHLSYISCRSNLKKIWNKEAYLDVNALPFNFLKEEQLGSNSHCGTMH